MESGGQAIIGDRCQVMPVFRGLADAKTQGKEIAGIVGVAPPTVSKWRTGRLETPAATLVFLTLLLADRINSLQDQHRRQGRKGLRFEATLKTIHRRLRSQEAINSQLHPGAMRQGARLFRQWWRRTEGAA